LPAKDIEKQKVATGVSAQNDMLPVAG